MAKYLSENPQLLSIDELKEIRTLVSRLISQKEPLSSVSVINSFLVLNNYAKCKYRFYRKHSKRGYYWKCKTKYSCTDSTFKSYGKATSKKEAKEIAASFLKRDILSYLAKDEEYAGYDMILEEEHSQSVESDSLSLSQEEDSHSVEYDPYDDTAHGDIYDYSDNDTRHGEIYDNLGGDCVWVGCDWPECDCVSRSK